MKFGHRHFAVSCVAFWRSFSRDFLIHFLVVIFISFKNSFLYFFSGEYIIRCQFYIFMTIFLKQLVLFVGIRQSNRNSNTVYCDLFSYFRHLKKKNEKSCVKNFVKLIYFKNINFKVNSISNLYDEYYWYFSCWLVIIERFQDLNGHFTSQSGWAEG